MRSYTTRTLLSIFALYIRINSASPTKDEQTAHSIHPSQPLVTHSIPGSLTSRHMGETSIDGTQDATWKLSLYEDELAPLLAKREGQETLKQDEREWLSFINWEQIDSSLPDPLELNSPYSHMSDSGRRLLSSPIVSTLNRFIAPSGKPLTGDGYKPNRALLPVETKVSSSSQGPRVATKVQRGSRQLRAPYKSKPKQCEVNGCGYMTEGWRDKRAHANTHTRITDAIKCRDCALLFLQFDGYRAHLIACPAHVHADTAVWPSSCSPDGKYCCP